MVLQNVLFLLRPHQRRLLQATPPCTHIYTTFISTFSSSSSFSSSSTFSFSRHSSTSDSATASPKGFENDLLLENLTVLGVDLERVRVRQPGVLRKDQTNERGLAEFLRSKGASREVIAGIISRFPRAITRSGKHLEERWRLWRNVFQSDAEIVKILDRSPESFFRSSDNENLEKNILFLTSLGIRAQDLPKLLTKAPRVFSNSLELNRTMVDLLQSVGMGLGGRNHEAFAKAIISRNVYVLTRSTKRVQANIELLLSSLRLGNTEALDLLQGHGAEILDISHNSLKRNVESLQKKLRTLGCRGAVVKDLVLNYAVVLFFSPETLNRKLDCLVEGGVDVRWILEKPKVLDFSAETLKQRLDDLNRLDYDFNENGIAVLDLSKKRFQAKLDRLREFGH